MILTKTVQVRPNSKTLKYYKGLGYDCNMYTKIEIPIEHLTRGSHQIVDVKCDFCGKEKKLDYNSYWRNTKHLTIPYSCSEKCGIMKRVETNLKKYGVKNPIELEEFKMKRKDTYIKTYGVDHPSKSIIIQKNTKNTNLINHGDENYRNIQQTIQTNLEKYGVKNTFQNKKSYQTKKNKIIEKYKNNGLIDIKNKKYILRCDNGHLVELDKHIFYNRIIMKTPLCSECNPIGDYHRSGLETQLSDFIKNNYIDKIELNKKFSYKELDIYLPDLKLAFEFNGVYWHNELNKPNIYHLDKTEFCEKKEIKLIHIYEDDWSYKQDIVKSRILNLLGKSNKIMARKCKIKEITDNKLVREFLEKNHIQGFVGSKIKIGLFYNDDLVSLMTFGSKRKIMRQDNIDNVYEMLRFCNKINTSVIGGANKLFNFFLKNYHPKEIISYADRSWSQGDIYKKLGFKFVSKTPPNYYYVIDGIRKHRFNFRKNKLTNDGFDSSKTEHQIMLERKIYRIYDSGHLKYIFISH